MRNLVNRPWSWWRCLLLGAGVSLLLNLLPVWSGQIPPVDRDAVYSFVIPAARFALVTRFSTGEFSLRRFVRLFVLSMAVLFALEVIITGENPIQEW